MLVAQVSDGKLQLGGFLDKYKVNADEYKEIIECFKQLDINNRKFTDKSTGKTNWEKIAKAIEGCDDNALSYFKTLDDGNGIIDNQAASVKGLSAYLEKSGRMFDFAAVKATLLNTALNAGVFLFISLTVQKVAEAFDSYSHRAENARKRTDEISSDFKQINDTLSAHRKTVSELADRYDELSSGINRSSNSNVSLSTEEYAEFLDINEKLADSFPELSKGIDENGNSILTLGTKGTTAKEQLEELLQAEESLNNFRAAQGLDEAFEGVYTYIQEADQAALSAGLSIEETDKKIKEMQELYNAGIDLKGGKNVLFSGDADDAVSLNRFERIKEAANTFYNSLDKDRQKHLREQGIFDARQLFYMDENFETGKVRFYSDLTTLDEEEINSLNNQITRNFDDISEFINEKSDELSGLKQGRQEAETAARNAWSDYLPQLTAGMSSQQSFKNLDEDLQLMAVKIVEGFDYHVGTEIAGHGGTVADFLREKVINPMTSLTEENKAAFSESFRKLLQLDPDDLSKDNQAETEKYISTIASLLEKDPVELRVALGFDTGEEQGRYKEALSEAKRRLGGYGDDSSDFEANNATGSKLDDFWSENVATEEDWVLWQTVTAGITDAQEAMEAYTEARKKANAVKIDTLSFDDAFGRLENIARPVMDAVENAWSESFNDDGTFDIDPDKALGAVSAVKNAIESVNSNKALGVTIDTSSLETLAGVLSDTSSTADEVQQAYSNVAGALMDSLLPALQNMDASQLGMFQSFMQGMGILNAEELIIQQLGYSYDTYAAAKEAAAGAGIDLANATTEDILKFAGESAAAEEDKIALLAYYQYKIIASGATIDTNDSITQLLSEYEQLGINCEKLKEYLGLHGAEEGSGVDMKYRGFSSSTEGYDTGAKTPPKLPDIPKGADEKRAKTASGAARSAKTETNALSGLNSEMDRLQSSYKSLCDIRDTYNQNGKITVDQYQELTNMGFTFLSQLVDENGQLGLNASAFERLSQAKLEEMQIQMARNAADTINGLKTEAAAVEYLTYANEQLRNAALGAAEAELEAAVVNARRRGGSQAEAVSQIYQGYQAAKQMD